MITIKNLNKKQKELLLKMSNQELKDYINNIIHEYYNCITNQDAKQLNQCIVNLNKIRELFADKNIDKYITYELINGFNNVLLNSSINDFKMIELKEPGLNPNNDKLLYRTDLDNILDAIFNERVIRKEKELRQGIKSNEDILKLFNYEDYAR